MKIGLLDQKHIPEYSNFSRGIISKTDYYSPLAKKGEMKKFLAKNIRIDLKNKNKVYFYITEKGKIIAFRSGYFDCGTFWGDWIGVDPKFRRKGISLSFQNYLENYLKKFHVHKIWCDCRTDNKESINSLKKRGYRKIAKIKNYWYHQDFYIWEKLLK